MLKGVWLTWLQGHGACHKHLQQQGPGSSSSSRREQSRAGITGLMPLTGHQKLMAACAVAVGIIQ
jgi:hypothetical protein